MKIRPMVRDDRPAIADMLTSAEAFTDQEVRVALEVIDAGFDGEYVLLVVEIDGAARAYACLGQAGLTESSWYLYWICVHRDFQRAGIGRRLQLYVEDYVRAAGGDRIVLETSGRPDYERTRRFYVSAAYREVGRIPDFYKPGDDCVVLCKLLDPASVVA
jgi:ribosomal protein S18 acetylase RimI-like enzyme